MIIKLEIRSAPDKYIFVYICLHIRNDRIPDTKIYDDSSRIPNANITIDIRCKAHRALSLDGKDR